MEFGKVRVDEDHKNQYTARGNEKHTMTGCGIRVDKRRSMATYTKIKDRPQPRTI
jgi:hypothetical protein